MIGDVDEEDFKAQFDPETDDKLDRINFYESVDINIGKIKVELDIPSQPVQRNISHHP